MSSVPPWMSSEGYYCYARNLQPHWVAGLPCIDVQCFGTQERSCELGMEGQKAG